MSRRDWTALLNWSNGVLVGIVSALLLTASLVGGQSLINLTHTVFNAGATSNILKLNGNAVTSRTITLTDAQIKALPTTPITLVAAQGSGLGIHVLFVTLSLNASAGAYTNINGTYAALDFTGYSVQSVVKDSGASITTLNDFLGTAGPSVIFTGAPYLGTSNNTVANFSTNKSIYSNTALRLSGDNNGSGNWTGGNAANTLKIIVYYAVETL